jgi:serine protease Do
MHYKIGIERTVMRLGMFDMVFDGTVAFFSWIVRLRWVLFSFAVIYGGYTLWYRYVQLTSINIQLEQRLSMHQQEPLPSREIVEKVVTAPGQVWSSMQHKFRNAVAQVFSQVAEIDIMQPYRAPGQSQSTGTAFFISDDGELVTNAHVIDQAKAVWIQIPGLGKRQLDVDIVGICFDRDLALLKLRPDSLERIKKELGGITTLSLGDSDTVDRAEEIMAIGYPLGQQGLKSTVGVVSGREQHLIQIDAAINPGNSGGPSVDMSGNVIGINTMYIAGAQNVGYIIPVNELQLVLDELREKKIVRKPFLGILYSNAGENETEFLGNPQPGGVYVVNVYKDSPLYRAGVQPGDMVYKINGNTIDTYGDIPYKGEKISLIDYVSQLKFGQTISLVVYRKGVRKDLSFTLDESKMLPIRKIYPGYEPIDYEIIAGMLVQPLTINHLPQLVNIAPGLTRYAEMKHQMEPALIITHIFPDSIAQRSRTLLPGAIIGQINGTTVKTLADFRTALFKSLDTGYLTIETMDQVLIASKLERLIPEMQRLSRDYFFQLSPAVEELIARDKKSRAS